MTLSANRLHEVRKDNRTLHLIGKILLYVVLYCLIG